MTDAIPATLICGHRSSTTF